MKKLILAMTILGSISIYAKEIKGRPAGDICSVIERASGPRNGNKCLDAIIGQLTNEYVNAICYRIAKSAITPGLECIEETAGNEYPNMTKEDFQALFDRAGSSSPQTVIKKLIEYRH